MDLDWLGWLSIPSSLTQNQNHAYVINLFSYVGSSISKPSGVT
jgi:hypothetical protein